MIDPTGRAPPGISLGAVCRTAERDVGLLRNPRDSGFHPPGPRPRQIVVVPVRQTIVRGWL